MISGQTVGASDASSQVEDMLKRLANPTITFSGSPTAIPKTVEEKLYDALAAFKLRTAAVAMHMDRDWRTRLFAQLDNLLGVENWEHEDLPPSVSSFSTFLRMLLLLRPEVRPGLGASHDGGLIAAWTSGNDRLTVECLSGDMVQWHLAVTIGGERERAAGLTPLRRLVDVLAPYDPRRWFAHEHHIPAARGSHGEIRSMGSSSQR
jgi:hypothetical protein